MSKISAGLLMYRYKNSDKKNLEVFLVHPGGPFFKNRSDIWGIPKGLREGEEDLLETAQREFKEETGIDSEQARMTALGSVEYNNKIVSAWAFESNLPENFALKSNLTPQGWPENDRGEFFDMEIAKEKIFPAQKPFINKLQQEL